MACNPSSSPCWLASLFARLTGSAMIFQVSCDGISTTRTVNTGSGIPHAMGLMRVPASACAQVFCNSGHHGAPSGWPSKNRACFVQYCNRQRACMNRNACRCIFRQKSPLETSWNLQIACELLEKKENKRNTGKKKKKRKIPKLILHPFYNHGYH